VLIKDGRIIEIGSVDDIALPTDFKVIQSKGAYLMPGLADMHTHLSEFDPDPQHLILYLAHGVTTLRSLNTPWKIMKWRDKVNAGELLGPTIYLSGPSIIGVPPDMKMLILGLRIALWLIFFLASAFVFALTWIMLSQLAGPEAGKMIIEQWSIPWVVLTAVLGIILIWLKILPLAPLVAIIFPQATLVETASQARAAVKKQVKAGVDFIKPYDYLTRETYIATIKAAQKYRMYTAGHIPDDPEVIAVKEALTIGQNEIVHMDEFSHEFWPDYVPGGKSNLDWDIDLSRIDDVAEAVAEHKTAVTATLVTNEIVLLGIEDPEAILQKPEYRFVRQKKIRNWQTEGRFIKWQGQEKYRREKWRPLLMQLTKALNDHGATLLMGTDVSVEGIIPGFSAHQELELLVEAGLTNYEALCCGTRNAAIIADRMGKDSDWGTIEVGNRADLILLADNPLADISNTRSQIGVMLRGEWFSRSDLDQMLADFIATYK
jgi:imidazolonepropionase-like amidohydrolase